MEFSGQIILILFCVALLAGLIDTLAGGGGLITIPSLMLCGVPPLFALGTNKLQGAAGTATATYVLIKSKAIQWPHIRHPMATAFLGAAFGTATVQFVNTNALAVVVPFVLAVIAIYFLLLPFIHVESDTPKLSEKNFNRKVIPIIGFYDGMFGPGTGSFFSLASVALRGKDLLQATVMAKPLNFATNIASLIIFLISGHILWTIGAAMMLGQFLGARVASHFLFKINKNLLRYLVVIMCAAMLTKYFFSAAPH